MEVGGGKEEVIRFFIHIKTTKMADVKGPRKGNKTTELIVGTAALKMQTASKNLNDAMVHAMKMTEVLETTTLKVSDMEQKIEDLAVEYGKESLRLNLIWSWSLKPMRRGLRRIT